MPDFSQFGRLLIYAGAALIVAGILITLGPKIPFIGRLPGDFSFRRGNVSFYFPIATCIIISLLLTLLMNFFKK